MRDWSEKQKNEALKILKDTRTIFQKIKDYWKSLKNKNKLKDNNVIYNLMKTKMNVWGIFWNLELYIPFDAKDEFSWVTSMSLSTLISFKK